jgi:hypothetical protein
MKKLALIGALLLCDTAIAADNNPATMTCYFQTGEYFTVVGQNGNTMIAWGNNGFRPAASVFEDPWLTVVERSDNGNIFKMLFNARTKSAAGETTFTDGHKSGGPLWCAFK